MQAQATASYTVSPQLLAREDFRAACQSHDFAELFRLMRKYDGASQDRISSPVEGLTQSRVSRIVRGSDRIAGLNLILRIADALRIPGAHFGLAARPWETWETDPAPGASASSTGHAGASAPMSSPAPAPLTPGQLVERRLAVEIDIDADGWARLTYEHELHNGTTTPFTRLSRELWFEHTDGGLDIQAVPRGDRSVIVQRIHDTRLNAKFACQIFPAMQPGDSAVVGYACTGGRFVYDHYWRQSVTHHTDELTIRLHHRGITSLTRCSALEERPDGSEVSATEGLTLRHEGAMPRSVVGSCR